MSSSGRRGCAGRLASTVMAAAVIVSLAAVGCTTGPPAAHTSHSQAAPGAQLWARLYDAEYGNPGPSAIAASPDGKAVFITGWIVDHKSYGYATVAYDSATGRQLWTRLYNGAGDNGVLAPSGIAVSPDGRIVFVTGTRGHSPGADATIAYSASTGQQLWLRIYKAPAGGAVAKALVVSPDGRTVYVTGSSGGTYAALRSNGGTYTTIAYNTATGAQRWLSQFMGKGYRNSQARNIAISPDGKTLYVTGQTGPANKAEPGGFRAATRQDYLTVAYNAATGAVRWFTRFNGRANGNDKANALVVAPDGKTVYVTGSSRGRSSNGDFATVAYNAATGAQRWVNRYNGPANAFDDGSSLAITPDGRTLIVAGSIHPPRSGPGKNLGYATIAYNATTGSPVWTRLTLGYSRNVNSRTLVISPDGSTVYVTGVNAVGSKFDYATVAYAVSSGATQWLSLYSGNKPKGWENNSNFAIALALSPDGSTLYVTGIIMRVKHGGWVTVAYRA